MGLSVLLCLPMVLHLTHGASVPPEDCCSTKTVGNVTYSLVDSMEDLSGYGCLNNCVYTVEGDSGSPRVCFKAGDLPVHCGDTGTCQCNEPRGQGGCSPDISEDNCRPGFKPNCSD